MPISAEWMPDNSVQVLFDRELAPGVLDPSNWHATESVSRFGFNTASAAGSVVTLSNRFAAGVGPSLVLDYAPPPFDLLSLQGTPAAAFANFPISVP